MKSYKNRGRRPAANAEICSETAAASSRSGSRQFPPEAETGARPEEVPAYEKPVRSPGPGSNAPTPAGKTAVPRAGPSKRGRKSLKQATAEADLIEIPADEVLFSKQYYTMGEVSEMFRVNQSLLRYWETEFDILQPRKNKKATAISGRSISKTST